MSKIIIYSSSKTKENIVSPKENSTFEVKRGARLHIERILNTGK